MGSVPSRTESRIWIRAFDHFPFGRWMSVSAHRGKSDLLHSQLFLERTNLGFGIRQLVRGLLWHEHTFAALMLGSTSARVHKSAHSGVILMQDILSILEFFLSLHHSVI